MGVCMTVRVLQLAVFILLVSCQPTPQNSREVLFTPIVLPVTPTVSPPTLSPKSVALGKTVYATHCAACHGANLEGEEDWKVQNEDGSFRSPPHDASGHTWHHGDPTLWASILQGGARFEGENIGGTSPMPAFAETLTDEEITAVINYIKSTWPADIRILQWEATLREQQLEN